MSTRDWVQDRINFLGGLHIFLYGVARLAGCIILLGLSLVTFPGIQDLDRLSSVSPPRQILLECSELLVAVTFVSWAPFYLHNCW